MRLIARVGEEIITILSILFYAIYDVRFRFEKPVLIEEICRLPSNENNGESL
jgi:hypothetical protein